MKSDPFYGWGREFLGRLFMTKWEKMLQKHFVDLGYRVEWAYLNRGGTYLLAWRGREVQLVFADPANHLHRASVEQVRDKFLDFISYLTRQAAWRDIFKGRDVRFRWASLSGPSEEGNKKLSAAGVESFQFGDNDGLSPEKRL